MAFKITKKPVRTAKKQTAAKQPAKATKKPVKTAPKATKKPVKTASKKAAPIKTADAPDADRYAHVPIGDIDLVLLQVKPNGSVNEQDVVFNVFESELQRWRDGAAWLAFHNSNVPHHAGRSTWLGISRPFRSEWLTLSRRCCRPLAWKSNVIRDVRCTSGSIRSHEFPATDSRSSSLLRLSVIRKRAAWWNVAE